MCLLIIVKVYVLYNKFKHLHYKCQIVINIRHGKQAHSDKFYNNTMTIHAINNYFFLIEKLNPLERNSQTYLTIITPYISN
jgi:hypothetical protein